MKEMTEGRRLVMRLGGVLLLACFGLHMLAGLQTPVMGAPAIGIAEILIRCLFLIVVIGMLAAGRMAAAIGFTVCAVCEMIGAWQDIAWYLAHIGTMGPAALVRLLWETLAILLWLALSAAACFAGRHRAGTWLAALAASVISAAAAYYFTAGFRWGPGISFVNWTDVIADWLYRGQPGLMQQQLVENTALVFGAAGSILLAVSLAGRPLPQEPATVPAKVTVTPSRAASAAIERLAVFKAMLDRRELTEEAFEVQKQVILTHLFSSKDSLQESGNTTE